MLQTFVCSTPTHRTTHRTGVEVLLWQLRNLKYVLPKPSPSFMSKGVSSSGLRLRALDWLHGLVTMRKQSLKPGCPVPMATSGLVLGFRVVRLGFGGFGVLRFFVLGLRFALSPFGVNTEIINNLLTAAKSEI